MGMFLSLSGVLSADGQAVRDAICEYTLSTGGEFELRAGTTDDENIGVMKSTETTTTVLYPNGFSDWDEVSKHLSLKLKKPVFSFHIHDSDFWMFIAFENGEEVAWFNPLPDYWREIDEEDVLLWAGDARKVASLVPGVEPSSIERYFERWNLDAIDGKQKAYADDEFAIGADWQLTDFMRRLGFAYPLDDSGKPTGETFYLEVDGPTRTGGSTTIQTPTPKVTPARKPWWKFW